MSVGGLVEHQHGIIHLRRGSEEDSGTTGRQAGPERHTLTERYVSPHAEHDGFHETGFHSNEGEGMTGVCFHTSVQEPSAELQ